MTVLSDNEIDVLARNGMITPYVYGQVRDINGVKTISYGLSSYGYDIRCANEFKVFHPNNKETIVDPKNFKDDNYETVIADSVIIPPNSFVLTRTVEYIKMPRDVIAICTGKSTYARCGIIANVTPIEPEWEGYITIELSNTTPIPAKVYANEGIAQLVFFRASDICSTSYKDKGGKYQGQIGVTGAIV